MDWKAKNAASMMTRSPWLLTLSFLVLTGGCSRGLGVPVRQPDGSYSISCKGPLSDCLRHAERACRDEGYTVAEGRDVREFVGHESGQSHVLIESSTATIYCGTHAPKPPIELKREAPPVAAAPVVAAPAPAAAPVCVPGATQACVGPAGCSGGQACKADGSGYDPCNCG